MDQPTKFVPKPSSVTAIRYVAFITPIVTWLKSRGFEEFDLDTYLRERSYTPADRVYGRRANGDFAIMVRGGGLLWFHPGQWLVELDGLWFVTSDEKFHQEFDPWSEDSRQEQNPSPGVVL